MIHPLFLPDMAPPRPAPAAGEAILVPVQQALGAGSVWIHALAGKLLFSAAVLAVILAGFRLLTDGERGPEHAARTVIRCATAVLALCLIPFLLDLIADVCGQAGESLLWGMLGG